MLSRRRPQPAGDKSFAEFPKEILAGRVAGGFVVAAVQRVEA